MPAHRQAVAVAAVTLCLVAACTAADGPADVPTGPPPSPTPSTAPSRPAAAPATIADLDGDGAADLVAVDRGHAPDDPEDSEPQREGAVEVALATGQVQRVTMSQLGLEWSDSSHFGAGRLVADLNLDGYADVVVGDPTPEPEGDSRGALYVLWGGPDGLSPARFATLALGPAESFTGWSLALVAEPERVLAAGTRHTDGGGVALFPLAADGSLGPVTLVDLGTAGVPGDPAGYSEFGSVLAAGGSVLAIGDPEATVAGRRGAGAVTLLRPGVDGFAPRTLSQAGAAVPGAAEVGDRFGASVSLADDVLAVGVPGEDVDGHPDAGRVYAFDLSGDRPALLAELSQDSTDVPGQVGQGHGFGESVTVARPCPGAAGVLVGVPGDSSSTDGQPGGAAQLIALDGADCRSQVVPPIGTPGRDAPPTGAAGSLTVLRGQDPAVAQPVAVRLADGTVATVEPPFTAISARYQLRGDLVAPG